jgi:hypothetical protein
MDRGELMTMIAEIVEGVGLVKFEGIVRLLPIIDSHHFEPGAMVAH